MEKENFYSILDEMCTYNLSTYFENAEWYKESLASQVESEMPSESANQNTLRENIIGRKLRVSFIGNISVGKSTVLNCIIGEEILPVNYDECTYRGVIIRHEEKGPFKLFKTKLIKRGIGNYEYYYCIFYLIFPINFQNFLLKNIKR